MEQLLLHLLGDYILQNDWMALNKKKKGALGRVACGIHCIIYSLPFLLITSYPVVICIAICHWALDRENMVTLFLQIRNGVDDDDNFGFSKSRPRLLTVWLNIITDNSFHLIINYSLIRWMM